MVLGRMPSVMELTADVNDISIKCARWKSEFEASGTDELSGCFGLLHNASRLTMETMAAYNQLFRLPFSASSQEELKKLQDDNVERIMMITKWNFVNSISYIEFSIKEHSKHLAAFFDIYAKSKRVYLRDLLKRGLNLNPPLLSIKDFKEWECLLEVRNTVVHNSGISDEDKDCSAGGIALKFRKNVMVTGHVGDFIKFTQAACELFSAWAKAARK